MVISGYSMLNGLAQSNAAIIIATLRPFGERTAAGAGVNGIIAQTIARTNAVPARAIPFNLPPIQGLGTAGASRSSCRTSRAGRSGRWPL